MKTSTIALVVTIGSGSPAWIDTLSDEGEIEYLDAVIQAGEMDPLQRVYEYRAHQQAKEEEMEDYVEGLLSQPFVSPKIQEHGIMWLKSKIKIEQYQEVEERAAKVVAEYAFKIFLDDLHKTDFFLVSPNSQVRIRVFTVAGEKILKAS